MLIFIILYIHAHRDVRVQSVSCQKHTQNNADAGAGAGIDAGTSAGTGADAGTSAGAAADAEVQILYVHGSDDDLLDLAKELSASLSVNAENPSSSSSKPMHAGNPPFVTGAGSKSFVVGGAKWGCDVYSGDNTASEKSTHTSTHTSASTSSHTSASASTSNLKSKSTLKSKTKSMFSTFHRKVVKVEVVYWRKARVRGEGE